MSANDQTANVGKMVVGALFIAVEKPHKQITKTAEKPIKPQKKEPEKAIKRRRNKRYGI